jgi:RimJ/RimL family protein N-acetyltransferase
MAGEHMSHGSIEGEVRRIDRLGVRRDRLGECARRSILCRPEPSSCRREPSSTSSPSIVSRDPVEAPPSTDRDHYQYVPLRRGDIEALRQFRNAQLDVLRQAEPISSAQQEHWYEHVVIPTQREPQPTMMLVSILAEPDRFIGYGGLTNIEWGSRRAEVSFLVDPVRANDPCVYRRDMSAFLEFLKCWAFTEVGLNRLFTETYAFRDAHIGILEHAGFSVEGRLRQHVVIGGKLTDSIMHGLLSADERAK